ncbi:signal peptidase [Bacillus sp. SLBN-46]|uniref:hypothetical protein n=1 Tax=Bacillus sp. SLBN-46 TaxID=3042283 RepID=UPI002859ED2A|nr:hypothetical protein [Bacillus sp. SLBN-46]MDR6121925.1 signal peptidase [Bacillus sp. SLBN-46]
MLIDEPIFKLLKQAINKDGWIELPAFGNSMFPYIRSDDVCRFSPCDSSQLKKGDVVLVQLQTGQLIAHRLVKKQIVNYQHVFILKGDTNLGFDKPIEEGQILGKLVDVKKQHIHLSPDHFIMRLWGGMILTFPVLSSILRKYLNRKLKLQFK